MNNLFEQNIALRWGVIRKEDQQLVGASGFNAWDTNRGSRVEIAYDLGKAYWKKGYMSEILEFLIQFSFEAVGFHHVEALTNLDATPSMNLLMKLGFKEDGILRGTRHTSGDK